MNQVNQKNGLVVRLRFDAHGGRDETYLSAVDFFDSSFEQGWKLTYVCQELDTGMHEDLDRIPDQGIWDVEYQAVGQLKEKGDQ